MPLAAKCIRLSECEYFTNPTWSASLSPNIRPPQLWLPEYILIPIAVGLGVGLMILFNVTHPPAGGNPVIIIIGGVSINYLFSPIITGSILILVFGVILNRFILKKNYPK